MRKLGWSAAVVVALLIAVSAWAAGPTPPVPIPYTPELPLYVGHPATAHPISGISAVPRNPFMAANGLSEIHNDGWQTDAFTWAGPLGRKPQRNSTLINHDCASITFDHHGRIVSICVGASGPQLYMFDPKTLATLATLMLPPRQHVPQNVFQDFTGGGYFYLDNRDRVVTATTTKHIYVIAETGPSPGFKLVRDYDLSHILNSDERITSALPDWHGLLWVVARHDGVVVTLNFKTGRTHVVRLGHFTLNEIENSFATDASGAVYIATNRKLYRFGAGADGIPKIVWQIVYPNSHKHKPGQVDDGTGTTPTVMPGGFVNITDNADPMDVMVYRTAAHLPRGVSRTVCRVPVFKKGGGDTENSLIGAGGSMIVENNYGYTSPADVSGGKVTAGGVARVDLDRDGDGCRLVWTNWSARAPTVVPKLSLATGLVYLYTKDRGAQDPWYWTALDFRTGKTIYKQESGTGNLGYNNNYAGLALGRNGHAYLGVLGGLISMWDGK